MQRQTQPPVRRGVSLLELLIVLGLIALLASILLTAVLKAWKAVQELVR